LRLRAPAIVWRSDRRFNDLDGALQVRSNETTPWKALGPLLGSPSNLAPNRWWTPPTGAPGGPGYADDRTHASLTRAQVSVFPQMAQNAPSESGLHDRHKTSAPHFIIANRYIRSGDHAPASGGETPSKTIARQNLCETQLASAKADAGVPSGRAVPRMQSRKIRALAVVTQRLLLRNDDTHRRLHSTSTARRWKTRDSHVDGSRPQEIRGTTARPMRPLRRDC